MKISGNHLHIGEAHLTNKPIKGEAYSELKVRGIYNLLQKNNNAVNEVI